jgi:hypothetical protein
MASDPGRIPKRLAPLTHSALCPDASPSLHTRAPADEMDDAAELEGVGIVGPWPGSRLISTQPESQPGGETTDLDSEMEGRSQAQAGTAESVSVARARLREWLQRQAQGGGPDEAEGPADSGATVGVPRG